MGKDVLGMWTDCVRQDGSPAPSPEDDTGRADVDAQAFPGETPAANKVIEENSNEASGLVRLVPIRSLILNQHQNHKKLVILFRRNNQLMRFETQERSFLFQIPANAVTIEMMVGVASDFGLMKPSETPGSTSLLKLYAICVSILKRHYLPEEVATPDATKRAVLDDWEAFAERCDKPSTRIQVNSLEKRRAYQKGVINSLRGTWLNIPVYSPGSITTKIDIKTIDEPKALDFFVHLVRCVLEELPGPIEY
eukprot:1158766-Pelagomonas_calceolata.AAC.5